MNDLARHSNDALAILRRDLERRQRNGMDEQARIDRIITEQQRRIGR